MEEETLTKTQVREAFKRWIENERAHPEEHLGAASMSLMPASEVAEKNTDYLFELATQA